MMRVWMVRASAFLSAMLLVCLGVSPAFASLTFRFTSGNPSTFHQKLPSDSNDCPFNGPLAAYVSGTLTNTGVTVETNIVATLSGLPSGGFSITGLQTDSAEFGALAPGDSVLIAWHIAYPCDTSKSNEPGPTVTPTLSWASDQSVQNSQTLSLEASKAISANAGGAVISTTLGAGAVIGQIITADVQYDFGGIAIGDDIMTQPAGNRDFNAACLRLAGSEITGSNILAAPVGTQDQLFYKALLSQSGNNYFINVRYYFRYLCDNVVSTARPYAVQTSGTQDKYTGNYDGAEALVFDFPESSNPFTLSKTAEQTNFEDGAGPHVAVYSVTISNPSSFVSTIDLIEDTLPDGAVYVGLASGSDVSALNAAVLPSRGDTGTLQFAALSLDDFNLPAGGTLTLRYQVEIPDVTGAYTNSATAFVRGSVIGTDSVAVTVGGTELTATKTVSADGFQIPGSDVVYTFEIQNMGSSANDPDSIVLTDIIPSELIFFSGDYGGSPGAGPFEFATASTAISCCEAHASYSDEPFAPFSFDYEPNGDYDPAVTAIRLSPTGQLNGGESMTVRFRARLR